MQESEGVLCMRVSFRIALAGQVIGVSALYEQTPHLLQKLSDRCTRIV